MTCSDIRPNERGWRWSQTLQLWLGSWDGEFQCLRARWPRLYTGQHELVLTFAEDEAQRAQAEAQRVEQERHRAEEAERRAARLAAKLREFGIEEDALKNL